MISLIIGRKGSGKTKKLIDLTNGALETSDGHVVVIEKGTQLRMNISYRARLIDTTEFNIEGFDAFFGFISGVLAGDNDITDLFIDATLRIGGRDYDELWRFYRNLSELEAVKNTNVVFTVSAHEEELPAELFDICKKI